MPLPPHAPSLVSLDVFASAVELGSLSAAAKAHGISQPSASERIRQLERQLGVELLSRTPNGSVPTAAGVLVATWSESVLSASRELLSGVETLKLGSQHIRVAASFTVAEQLLPEWLGRLHHEHPSTRVELQVVNSTGVIDHVRSGDAALGFIESVGEVTGVKARQIGGDELVVVVSPSHSWTRRRTPISARDLATTPLVLREVGSGTREALELALSDAGETVPMAALELGSSSAVRAAAEAGAAPAVLSRLAVRDALVNGKLKEVQVSGLDLHRAFRAVWLSETGLDPSAKSLLRIAKSS